MAQIPDGYWLEYKKCSGECKQIKLLNDFYFRKDTNKYRNECKVCFGDKIKARTNREEKRIYNAKYRLDNYDTIIEKEREYRNTHKEETRIYRIKNRKRENKRTQLWYKNHPEKQKAKAKRRFERNKVDIRKRRKEREFKDPSLKISKLLRDRFKKALNGRFKGGSAIDALGCSIDDFKERFRHMFAVHSTTNEQMDWHNYGKKWHIDHIIPLAYFDLTDPKQVQIACNYRNLQPLWAEDNIKKGDQLPENLDELLAEIKEALKRFEI